MHLEKQEKTILNKCLVALAGHPLSGKSTLAASLVEKTNLSHFDIDICRWEIFPKTERYSDYRERAAMITCYGYLHFKAACELIKNKPILLTATYSNKLYHQMLIELAKQNQAPLYVFVLEAPHNELEKRIESRIKEGNPSVVNNLELALDLKRRYHPIEPLDDITVFKISTNEKVEILSQKVIKYLTQN